MKSRLLVFFVGCLLGLVVGCSNNAMPEVIIYHPTDSPTRATEIASDPTLMLGQQLYNMSCAHCHGYAGEGQIASTIQRTLDLGLNPVPAHDPTGHTWKHPDQLLLRVLQEGVQNPLNNFQMAGYSDMMTETEMMAIISYMKVWWTDEQRAFQRKLTEERAAFDSP